MEREREIELLKECLDVMKDGRPLATAEETLVDVAKYRDQARFERELDVLFRKRPNLVAHASAIAAPGDFITREVVGRPVILVRDQDGTARAFLNVCRHRGATVELREHGHCKRFVCPYHAWTYGTDGRLASVRHREGFPSLDLEAVGLVELLCREDAGLLWVCPDPSITTWEPDEATRTLNAELSALGSAESVVFASETRTWRANWKLIVDGGLESYHFRIAHRETVAPFFADNISTYEMLGDHVRSVLPRVSISELAERPRSEWSLREQTHVVYAIFPSATVLVQEGHFELLVLTPTAVDECKIEISTVVPDPGPTGHTDKERKFWAANHAFTKKTLAEDFELAEQIQRGIDCGANSKFRFATFEGALTQWHRLVDEKLAR